MKTRAAMAPSATTQSPGPPLKLARHGVLLSSRLIWRQAGRTSTTLTTPRMVTTQNGEPKVLSNDVWREQDAAAEPVVAEEAPGKFKWFQHWWPVMPTRMLDKERPQAHTLLGIDVVVWWSDKEQRWNVFQDRCPHRLSPLSQGRVSDGSLVCSYHGWRFNTVGTCTEIAQLEPAAQAHVCGSKRTCVTTYPTLEMEGLLYAWMDPSPEGLTLSKTCGVPKAPHNPSRPPGEEPLWITSFVPNDWGTWLEQSMDPSHVNFLHAGGMFKPENAIPMAHNSVPKIDLQDGFSYEHSGYERRNAGMQATRHFIAPYAVIGLYCMPHGTQVLDTRFVPVRPGWARTFAQFDFLPPTVPISVIRDTAQNKVIAPPQAPVAQFDISAGSAQKAEAAPAQRQNKPPAWAGLLRALNPSMWITSKVSRGELPHWLINNQRLTDEDVVIQHYQEVLKAREKLGDKDYIMPAVSADIGVAAINRWMHLAQYPKSLFGQQPGRTEPLPLERILDRHERHVQHCVQCQQGLATMTRVCWALAILSFVSGSLALGLLAATTAGACSWQATGLPAVTLGVAAALLDVAAKGAWDFTEDRFISGVKSWRKSGGMSLVKMP